MTNYVEMFNDPNLGDLSVPVKTLEWGPRTVAHTPESEGEPSASL